MKRLTTDNPKDNIENALNLFYAKDGWTWVRGGGPAPDYADISLCDFVRMLVKANIPDATLPENDDDLSDLMCDWLIDDPDSAEGIISLLYTAGWAFAELRHRLAAYEDTGLDPLEIETLKTGTCLGCSVPELKEGQALHKEWEEAYQQGRLVVLPCKVGDTVYKICPISTFLEIGDRWDGRIVKTDCHRCAYYACDCHDIGYQKDARNVIVERKMSTLERIVLCMPYFGTIYFLTREEAERALEGGNGDAG